MLEVYTIVLLVDYVRAILYTCMYVCMLVCDMSIL